MIRTAAVALGLTVALLSAGSQRAGAADLLANGGFEQGGDGWSINAGQLDAVGSPVYAGQLSGRFTGNGQPTTQFAYQVVAVQSDEAYEASGWIAAAGPGLTRAFLRVSWFDGGGQLVLNSDSDWLPQFDGAFYRLTTGVLFSPSAARSARLSATIQADSNFTVHLDEFSLAGPPAAPAPPTPQITPAPTIAPTAPPIVTPSPTPSPKPRQSPSRTPSPTAKPPPGPQPDDAVEPLVFPSLVNGSFEDTRGDGTPYGWRKQGGQLSSVGEPRTDGSRSLALSSQTSSTKWAYQTISVAGGAYYQASADALASEGTESAFLRVSWYASIDGSGPAFSSIDSTAAAESSDATFRRLMTEVVQAPAGAASAKFRLMLRPQSEQLASAYFDLASFSQTQRGAEEIVLGSARAGSADVRASAPRGGAEAPQASPEMERRLARLANVKPAATPGAANASVAGGRDNGWAIALALVVAAGALAIAGGYEWWQKRRAGAGGGGSPED